MSYTSINPKIIGIAMPVLQDETREYVVCLSCFQRKKVPLKKGKAMPCDGSVVTVVCDKCIKEKPDTLWIYRVTNKDKNIITVSIMPIRQKTWVEVTGQSDVTVVEAMTAQGFDFWINIYGGKNIKEVQIEL